MINKSLIKKKLNSEKGITGVDIVVAVTMIALTISVVMSIFINTNNTARKVTRTSGATRMATNILEQIEIMYYEEFVEELSELVGKSYVRYEKLDGDWLYNGKYIISGKGIPSGKRIFNTRIPNGYNLILDVYNEYGSADPSKFDLVKRVKVSVEFKVSGRNEMVSLSTTKKYDKLNSLANEPEIKIDYFETRDLDFGLDVCKFIKEVTVAGTTKYEVIDEKDPSVYSYTDSSVRPAMMIPTEITNSGMTISTLDSTKQYVNSSFYNDVYIWIPAHKITLNKLTYGYRNSNMATKSVTLHEFNNVSNTIICYTVDRATTEAVYKINPFALGKDGLWIRVGDLETTTNTYYKEFWNLAVSNLK